MRCTKCGAENQESATVCSRCDAPLGAAATVAPADGALYAGFWRRAAGFGIDYIITVFGSVILGALLARGAEQVDALPSLIALVGAWLYFALMESSSSQATIGKLAVGIKVVDSRGERIGFGRATGRYFAKILSGLVLLIGYLMAAFTQRKQGLHDMIADTLVVHRNVPSGSLAPIPANEVRGTGWMVVGIILVSFFPIGILAAIAIPAYQDYVTRAQVASGLIEANEVKTLVADWYAREEEWPETLEEIDVPANFDSPYVESIDIDSGTIVILFSDQANQKLRGRQLALQPADRDGNVVWNCGYAGADQGEQLEQETTPASERTTVDKKFLPASCRGP